MSSIPKRFTCVSIGMETGPPIGAQMGPLWSDVSWPGAA
jgi:hypothetical protein